MLLSIYHKKAMKKSSRLKLAIKEKRSLRLKASYRKANWSNFGADKLKITLSLSAEVSVKNKEIL